jgi:hypothetical protein
MMQRRAPVYVVLIHYPIKNALGEEITTAITNMDIHDGGRLAATYDIQRYYLTTPIEEQRSLVYRIRNHWVDGPGCKKNPLRRKALERVEHAFDLREVVDQITQQHDIRPLLIGTSAKVQVHQQIDYAALRNKIDHQTQPVALLFGTGWGISSKITPPIDLFLPPIRGLTDYNHLSVRAAMAITIDRLLSYTETA